MTAVEMCPRCGTIMPERPRRALSRADNITEVCPRCGTEEGLAAMMLQAFPEAVVQHRGPYHGWVLPPRTAGRGGDR